MEVVGNRGVYQNILIFITLVICLETSALMQSIPYIFAIAPYTNCPPPHAGITLCTQYACSLPFSQRGQFQNQQIAQLTTLGNSFGDYQCQKSSVLQWAKGSSFWGVILGCIVAGNLITKFGRRKMLIIFQALGLLGFLLVLFASELEIVIIGMFLTGFGTQTCFGMTFSMMKEVVSN